VYSPEPLELFLIRVKLNIVGVSRMHEADEAIPKIATGGYIGEGHDPVNL